MKTPWQIQSFLLFLFCQTAWSQSFDRMKLDAYFDALTAHQKFMGSVLVARDGKVLYEKSVGFANVENRVENSGNTQFRVGSVSKTFTAVLVLKAVEQGKLKLNQPLSDFFKEIKNAEKITIEQLLRHRSGIFNLTNDTSYFTWHTQPQKRSVILLKIASYNPVFEPDSKFEYSNSNYILLSYILEDIYKKSFSDLLETFIVNPLKLKNTQMGEKQSSQSEAAYSYTYKNGWEKETETDLSFVLGAGGILSTATDLKIFIRALFEGKLLEKESFEIMTTLKENYGMGLFQLPFYDKKMYGHTGSIDGFLSIAGYFPDEKITYIRLCNGLNFNVNDIDITVLSAVFNKPFDIPSFESIEVSEEVLNQYVGTYSKEGMPMQITIFKNGKQLMGQATNQQAFPLEATEKNKFKFDKAGIQVEFFPETKKMILKQMGLEIPFEKK
ncbi:serine hydrolase [Capnocytophaga sp.]|uniref:serine hydrolase domain-containing protein n=1 Tax=Capnocytophaga sp. TaxID=44737 RepID=UPI0026DD7AE0|nr:serine hydrolase domain-containing protein [Capnocytophaga sp.]MDO5104614.1 serine hydrolase domain-containing protein [Capnocytophaga sp.]